jgi:hypothetical protein
MLRQPASPRVRESLSLAQARRIALAAQGLADSRPKGPVDLRHLRGIFERIGILQIDSVNVLVRSHYLPIFSRLGPYQHAVLERAAYGKRRSLFEYWGHEASFLPLATQPLLRWRMDEAKLGIGTWKLIAQIAREQPKVIPRTLQAIRERGPLAASDFEGARGSGGWWGWSDTKTVLEYLFWSGAITTAHRRNFERLYDLTERVLPPEIINAPTPDRAEAQRELVRIAARALGVATEADLRDYFRLSAGDGRARVAELVETGELLAVRVESWKQPAYLFPAARLPRRVDARALLSPFDSLVWYRDRAERLFGFRYRIEIYVPAHLRIHGYYVLPFLFGDMLTARADLKSDRARSVLMVRNVHHESHASRDAKAGLRAELRELAGWLGLERVEYG